jgi:hypothetical protein
LPKIDPTSVADVTACGSFPDANYLRGAMQTRHHWMMIVVVALCAMSARGAWADDPRLEARSHYQAGLKFYTGGDYKSAVAEFTTAQQLAPADLNNYNLGLCYDKLGDAAPAIQYYREYLNKVPNADKRAEIEASIARLEAALKSAAAKQEDARKAEDAKKAKQAQEAEAAKKTDDDNAAAAGAAAGGAAAGGAISGGASVGVGVTGGAVSGSVGVGSTGTPSTGQIVSTGDAQLDRVATIDINSLRGNSGMPEARGPAPASGAPAGPAPAGAAPAGGTAVAGTAQAQPGTQAVAPGEHPDAPIYKKWWFWVGVAVVAYVVYEIATTNSNNGTTTARDAGLPPDHPVHGIPSTSGVTLFHF